MQKIARRSFGILIIALLLSLECCERYPEGDGKYCVTCRPEWDDDVNAVYNLMPTKLCEYNLNVLQESMDELIDKGYTCGKIREP